MNLLRLIIGLNKRPIIDQAIRKGCLFFDLDTAPSVESCLALLTTISGLNHDNEIILTTEKAFVVNKLRLLILQAKIKPVVVVDTDKYQNLNLVEDYTEIDFCCINVTLYKEEIDLL
jgi:hypothetical protein